MQVNNKQPMMTSEYIRRRSSRKNRLFIIAFLMKKAHHPLWYRKKEKGIKKIMLQNVLNCLFSPLGLRLPLHCLVRPFLATST
jgi:hypothetical protein